MVVPHQQLFLVPFSALTDPQGKYLIERHTIVTTPSIQALEVTRKKKQQQVKSSTLSVVVGNPTMPSIVHPQKGTLIQLPSLPGAQREGEKIAQFLNTQLLTGTQATKAKVLGLLSNAQYIHLATHGLLDDYSGWGIPGALALAPTNDDKGLLTSSEIQDLKLNAELIVLSACDTGRGDVTGDGIVGLSRALEFLVLWLRCGLSQMLRQPT
jgi:CHAT domain-containing protein